MDFKTTMKGMINMELMEAMRKRKSIRSFTAEPVPMDVIKEILSNVCWAPSAMNIQPWEFMVVKGEKFDLLRAAIVEKTKNGAPIQPDHLMVGWPDKSIYRKRQIDLAKQLFKAMDIPREDKKKRDWWLERGFRFFDAPAAVIIVSNKALTEAAPLLDIGAVMQNICRAALEWGLGILYLEVVRKPTGIPASKRLIIAIALGYPDSDFPANHIRSAREPAESLTTWVD